MNCPICHSNNKDTSNFCSACGFDLKNQKHTLLISGKQIKPYIPELPTDNSLPSKFSFEGERKLVTVLFAEISNYITLIEKLSPEDLHQVMDGFFHIFLTKIHKYQGTINQFTGNGIIAMFGAPLAIENHSRKACLAALASQRSVKSYAKTLKQKIGISFKIQIGLNSGSVVVGSIGDDLRYDYTAFGDTTYLAFMIQKTAKPGSVFLSHSVYKRVRNNFVFKTIEPISYKEKSALVRIYELKQDVPQFQSVTKPAISSALIGRDEELNKLKHHISKVIDGQGSIINLVGEAGIGKSRLIEELKKLDVLKKVALLEGRAVAFGKNLSFHPIINIFKNWAKISEKDPPIESARKLKNSIWGVCLHETSEIFPFVATLMGLRLSGEYLAKINDVEGEALEKLIISSIRKLLIKSAQTVPLVFILEDMHWADTSTIDFTESLMGLVESNPILFINIFRPGYMGTSERFLNTVHKLYPKIYTQISLQPLNRKDSETLVGNFMDIKALPFSVHKQILDRANGNPFFTEEIIRSIIDVEAAVLKNGVFRATSKINALVIPHTINNVLTARIDRLDKKTKNLLAVASVIGRSFFYRILADIVHPEEDFDQQLSILKQAQLIFDRNRMGELEYLFKHALTQEVVYESILNKKRVFLHLKVAASIERLFNDKIYEFYGLLAYHYGRGENLGKTEEYLLKAGEASLKSSASNEALNYFKEALSLYLKKYGAAADHEKIALFEKNIGLAYYNKGLFVNALEHFDIVLEHFGYGSPKNSFHKAFRLIFDMIFLIAKIYLPFLQAKRKPTQTDNMIFDIFQKRGISLIYLDTKRFFIENITFIKKLTGFDLKQVDTGVYSYCSSSGIFALTGILFGLSGRILKHAERLIDKNNIKELLCYEMYNRFHQILSGQWYNCKKYNENLVVLNLKKGRIWLAATYILHNGLLKVEQGLFKEVQLMTNKLDKIWEAYEYQNATGNKYFITIKLLLKRRKIKEALAEAEKGISFQKERGEELRALHFLGLKSIVQILQKDLNGAKISFNQVEEIISKKGRVSTYYIISYFMGRLLFDITVLEKAIHSENRPAISKQKKKTFASANKALKTANKCALDKTEALKLMGTFFWLINKQNKALKYWHESINFGKKIGSSVELSRTYFEVGKRLFEPKSNFTELNKIKRKDYLLKARSAFKTMDLQPDFKDLEGFADLRGIEL